MNGWFVLLSVSIATLWIHYFHLVLLSLQQVMELEWGFCFNTILSLRKGKSLKERIFVMTNTRWWACSLQPSRNINTGRFHNKTRWDRVHANFAADWWALWALVPVAFTYYRTTVGETYCGICLYYNLKGLVEITKQPVVYLKEILKEVCNYNLKNPHKNMWELKPENRHYQ